MRIAIDLDGVIFDTERYFRVASEIEDVNNFGLNNKINNNELKFQERYKWSSKFCDDFYSKNVFKIEKTAGFIPGAIKVLKMLKELGNELYIISARGIFSEKQIDISNELLKNNDVDIFKKKIYKAENKRKYVISNKIDIIIDDNLQICKDLKNICKTIYFKDAPNYENTDKDIKTVYNWGEIYRYFKEKNTK